jgi:site-specific DNA-methyltransferase (cytosine-N4-specific)
MAIYRGDARQVLAEMPAGSVDCIVTSPPYWGLRHYCRTYRSIGAGMVQ